MLFRKFISVCLLLLISSIFFISEAQNKNRIYLQYIDTYKDLAIEHQRKYKIPASITLAQGLNQVPGEVLSLENQTITLE